MKVLLLPTNTASDLSHKVKALRKIGVDARGLAFGDSILQSAENVRVISPVRGKMEYIRIARSAGCLYNSIKWADVLHWFWGFNSLRFSVERLNINIEKIDKKIVKRLKKPGVVQWSGSDIRIPEADFPVNPFYEKAFREGYEYSEYESRANSLANQEDFAEAGFYPLEFIGMERYIDKRLFPKRFAVWQSVDLSQHEPRFPAADEKKPLLVHSPSAPIAKGTKYILQAVEHLKEKYDFDFKLVQNLKREEALKIMRECDVYIDQIILGAHGAAAVEAMAFGKPVVCYINDEIGKNYPADLPIVSANPENIAEKLETLLKDGKMRNELGRRGRKYVEKYHAEEKIARDLVKIYEEVIRLHKTTNPNG